MREREIKKRKIGKEKRGLGLEKIFEIRKRKKRKKKGRLGLENKRGGNKLGFV